jgi:hypothetical protein
MQLTAYEAAVLEVIARHQYNAGGGEYPQSYANVHTWLLAEELAKEARITSMQFYQSLSSLISKGLVWVQSSKGEDRAVGFTPEGYDVYTQLYPKEQEHDQIPKQDGTDS